MNAELKTKNIELLEAIDKTSLIARKQLANLIADNHMTEQQKTKYINQKIQDLHNRFYDLQIISQSIIKDFQTSN